ncbi:MAG: hypothetical protein MJ187_03005 [Alphaproteobacteria bacterium]|nr:hypothetical protein [Alphaproteobacteria bacterium]
MTNLFHRNLNRMALFTAFLAVMLIVFRNEFLQIAVANIYLNGVIIGATLFGIGLCFVQMFALLPEYRWLRAYCYGYRDAPIPPCLLRPVALMLRARPARISADALNGMLDMILIRFEDSRESVRYITNTLIFLGLLGTFLGLIMTVGSFADLINGLDFSDTNVLTNMQQGLALPLSGMATAFTSSLMGLAGSLSVGFLGLQLQQAQNSIFCELEEYLSMHTRVAVADDEINN